MFLRRTGRFFSAVALLSALSACASSSAPPLAKSLCRNGINKSITVELDALDKTAPLDVRACIQQQPCHTAHTTGLNKLGQGGIGFFFTLDDHHQQMTVPVDLLITSGGKQIAKGIVQVPIVQDFVTDTSTGKKANCGGHAEITVTPSGQFHVLPR